MKISIGADHGGLALKEVLVAHLQAAGHTVLDHGAFSDASVDYPDYARLVGLDVTSGQAERGILICTTGIGISIAANKLPGVRAALVNHEDEAALCRAHNHANIICFGQRHTTPFEAKHFTDIFLSTEPEAGRHTRRVEKIASLESAHGTATQAESSGAGCAIR